MKIKNLIVLLVVLIGFSANAQAKKFQLQTVAFYNFENLFDTINGPNNDEEWLPSSPQSWTGKKYKKTIGDRIPVYARGQPQ